MNGGLGKQKEPGREPNEAVDVESEESRCWVGKSLWMNSED